MRESETGENAEPMTIRQMPELDGSLGAMDWSSLRQVAVVLEKVNLGEWVAIMNSPRRSFWVNFWAGLARGIGMVVGAALVGLLFTLFSVSLLKKAFLHAGGLPWVGGEVREVIGFILRVARERQAAP